MTAFLESFMKAFRENVKKDADVVIAQQAKQYEKRLSQIQQNTASSLSNVSDLHNQQRAKLGDRMTEMIDKKLAESERTVRNEVAVITDDLFIEPKALHEKIKKAIKDLEQVQKQLQNEKKEWIKDDQRIAEWLGRPWKGADDEKKQQANDDEKQFVSDLEFVTIKIDDRTFRTYRKTLTQVPDSKLAKLFNGDVDDKHLLTHDKETNTYTMNCSPKIFAKTLEILRTKGAAQVTMTTALYAALLEFGVLEKFYPSLDIASLQMANRYNKEYHVVFAAYRSTGIGNTYYARWTQKVLTSTERKEDGTDYWQLNPADDSEIQFLQTGYYRFSFRCCQNYSSTAYVQIYVSNSGNDICYHYASSANNIRSYNFNDIRQFTEGQTLKFYVSTGTLYDEAISTYLCIEKIPEKILPSVGIWKATTSGNYYRYWNSAIKSSDRYQIKSNQNLTVNKGGLYRVSARVHTNYGSRGNHQMQMYEYRNGSNHQHNSFQASYNTNYQCHMFDVVCAFKQDDYVSFYDGSYGSANSAPYDAVQIQHIPFPDMVGAWKSSNVYNGNQRVWDYETWCSEMLYKLDANKSQIEIQRAGNYRISCNVTQYQGSNVAGYSALFVNNREYCKSRMGGYGGTYYYTTSIQEIVRLKKGDKIHIYSSNPYNSKDYNYLFIEKLM